MEFNATFNNISVISWQSVLLVEETGVHVPGENHWPWLVAGRWLLYELWNLIITCNFFPSMSKDAWETVSSFFSSSQLTTSSKLCQENLSFQSNFYTKVSKQIPFWTGFISKISDLYPQCTLVAYAPVDINRGWVVLVVLIIW